MPVVHLKDIEVNPAVVHVRKGGAVRWKWQDAVAAHNVTSRGRKRFRSSGTRDEGSVYRVVFHAAGTYRYVCTIHPSMKGRIVVTKHHND